MPLSPDRIKDIKTLFRNNGISYDRDVRTILFTDVNFQFFNRLRDFDTRAFQLSGDLAALNKSTRLSDGSIPFAVWLHNAAEQFSDIDTEKIFNHALDELTSAASTAAPIADPANVPAVEVREAIVQQNDMVYYGFLQSGALAGESVGRLHVPRHENGVPTVRNQEPTTYQGTGWLVSPDLIVTNHHVVNAREEGESNASSLDLGLQAQSTSVEFDFNSKDTAGHFVSAKTLEAFEPSLDFAILRLAEPITRKPLRLNPERIEITKDSYVAVNIIQHPYGGPKKVALRNNLIYDSNFPKLRYFTDTEHGSSGSPVFNDSWEVVALHRASTFVSKVQFQGRLAGWVNEGTHILAILDYLKTNNPSLYKEIMGGN